MKRILSFFSVTVLFLTTAAMFFACSPKRAQVKFTLSNDKALVFVLYKDYAPNTVKHFIELCEQGYYDNVALSDFQYNRIMFGEYEWNDDKTDLIIKDTDGIENLKGDEIQGWSVEILNNPLLHGFGTLSFYNNKQDEEGGSYDSAKVKLFISTASNAYYDSKYAIFGKLTKASEEVLRELLEEKEEDEEYEYPFDALNEEYGITLPQEIIYIKSVKVTKR